MAEPNPDFTKPSHVVGRYALYGRLAAGGMATVHLGRHLDSDEESKTVAVKRLHPQFCKDPEFVAMFIDEARLAARIKHPNVVETRDILTMGQELLLVMEYIRGECFSKLLRAARRKNLEPSLGVVGRIASGMLHGLHAAHEARDDEGELLNVVHRDISPQNVMVGVDGVAKVLDFGVAKASARIQITRDGQMKGKLSYMSPEQLQGLAVDRRADVFAAGVVLWEALTRRRLFVGEDASEVLRKILRDDVPPPSQFAAELGPEVDAVVLRLLSKDPDERYQTAEEAAQDVERAVELASLEEVGAWIRSVAGEVLSKRDRLLREIERVDAGPVASTDHGGSVTDSDTFQRIQTWAEREAARVVAEEEEIEVEDADLDAEATQTQADAAVERLLHAGADEALAGEEEPGTDVDVARAAAALDEEADSVVTLAQGAPFALTDPAPAQQIVAPVAPTVRAGRRSGRRWVAVLAAAAAVLGVSAAVLTGVDGSPLVRASRALMPNGQTLAGEAEPPASELAADSEVASADEPEQTPATVVVDVRELPEQLPIGESVAGEREPVEPNVEKEAKAAAPAPAPANQIALTRPSKPLSSRYRRRKAARRKKAQPARRRNAASSKRNEACREPYYYDAEGIKRLKMECL